MSDAAGLRALVDALVAAGVRGAVVCPGSRSTPLALALRMAGGLRVRVLYDERAAGFFALGMARTTHRPVVLAATSGTAVVEFTPAVVEAHHSRIPLVLLTADRPPELRDRGAPQTIDQTHLYGRAAKWFAELPLQDDDPVTVAHWAWVAVRAVAVAAEGPAGPVQVNVPFREPLLPDGPLLTAGTTAHAPVVAATAGRRTLDDAPLRTLADRIAGARRGLILAGPDDDPALPVALAALAVSTGFPIVADPLSGMRTGPHDRSRVVVRGDQLARPGPWIQAHAPDLVIRTGAMPTSKPMAELMSRVRPPVVVLDGDGGWRESSLVPATFVHADAARTATALTHILAADERMAAEAGWADDWIAADRTAVMAMDAWAARLDEPFEGAPYAILADALPDGASLWAGNSMPVRDLDAWLPSTSRAIAIRSNRGANGVDGVVSTALGAAAVSPAPVALAALAVSTGFPIVPDPLSGLRTGPHDR
ncbi:hypothetical protein BH20CHL7_BH20CHL7_19170 [soil metagenome]